MIRKVLPYLFLIILSIVLYSYSHETREDIKVEHNHKNIDKPYRVQLINYTNRYVCNDCDMMVKTYENSAQVVAANGDVYFFDDIGCMIKWLDRQNFKKEPKKYVYVKDTKGYLDATLAWYVRDQRTPLGYGFAAYEMSMSAVTSALTSSRIESNFGDFKIKKETKESYEYDEIKQFTLRGETLLHPMIKNELLIRNK